MKPKTAFASLPLLSWNPLLKPKQVIVVRIEDRTNARITLNVVSSCCCSVCDVFFCAGQAAHTLTSESLDCECRPAFRRSVFGDPFEDLCWSLDVAFVGARVFSEYAGFPSLGTVAALRI